MRRARRGLSSPLDQNVKNDAVLINGTPKLTRRAGDGNDDFVRFQYGIAEPIRDSAQKPNQQHAIHQNKHGWI